MLDSAILGKTIVANVAELVDALDLGSSGATRESSSLFFRTNIPESALGRWEAIDFGG